MPWWSPRWTDCGIVGTGIWRKTRASTTGRQAIPLCTRGRRVTWAWLRRACFSALSAIRWLTPSWKVSPSRPALPAHRRKEPLQADLRPARQADRRKEPLQANLRPALQAHRRKKPLQADLRKGSLQAQHLMIVRLELFADLAFGQDFALD